VGGEFTYRIQLPHAGLYSYHPYLREDYTQELGLYGNVFLTSGDPELRLQARAGQVLRLWLTNTGQRPGVQPELLLAPSEQAVADVLADRPELLAKLSG
jgi:FtsP/CotA-like multicopper oxidase with cupredoxin domain